LQYYNPFPCARRYWGNLALTYFFTLGEVLEFLAPYIIVIYLSVGVKLA